MKVFSLTLVLKRYHANVHYPMRSSGLLVVVIQQTLLVQW